MCWVFKKHKADLIYLTYIIFFVLLKVFASCVFAIEIIYFKQLFYFFKFLPFLLLPMLIEFFIFCANYNAEKSLAYYSKFFDFNFNSDALEVTVTKKMNLNTIKSIMKV